MNSDDASRKETAWYVIQTYPGYEAAVKGKMMGRLQAQNFHTEGMQILVPCDIMVSEQDRQRYAGVVLVKMHMQAELWNTIRNTPGVTGFVGIGSRPTAFYQQDWMDFL
jgi:transcription termination/antitermination protein NusG